MLSGDATFRFVVIQTLRTLFTHRYYGRWKISIIRKINTGLQYEPVCRRARPDSQFNFDQICLCCAGLENKHVINQWRTHLFGYLPHAVDELDEDWWSVLVCVILVTVAYPLQTHAGTHTQTFVNATNYFFLKKEHTKLKWTITVKEMSDLMLTEENLWPKLIHSFSIST